MTREELIAGKSHIPGEMRIGDVCGNPSHGVVGETALMVGRYCVAVAMPCYAGIAGEVDLAPKLTRANAERMVRVWNNHDALVEAFAELKRFGIEPSLREVELYTEAQAVLRRAVVLPQGVRP